MVSSSDAVAIDEDPEKAQMRIEALKAVQDAVYKQKKITTAFDGECLKLRQASGVANFEQPDSSVVGSSNMDLLHPYMLKSYSYNRSSSNLYTRIVCIFIKIMLRFGFRSHRES